MNTVKKEQYQPFTQYKLTNNLLQNLYKYDLTPTAKLVLVYLSTCYNPKHNDMFPKQRKIADKLGVSERTIVRAISELIKAGLIIIECKYTNHYKFTSKIVSQCFENLSDNIRQNDIKQYDNLTPHEPIKEPIKEPTINRGGNVYNLEDEKILRDYAIRHHAKNINAYVNKLKNTKSAEKILNEAKIRRYPTIEMSERFINKEKQYQKEAVGCLDVEAFVKLRNKLKNSVDVNRASE